MRRLRIAQQNVMQVTNCHLCSGSGIFISPTGVADNAGSIGLTLVLWSIGGLIAMLGELQRVNGKHPNRTEKKNDN